MLHICQNREREKAFLAQHGFPHAPFAVVDSPESLGLALKRIGMPSVLKTADFGYDGKGQLKLEGEVDLKRLWQGFHAPRGVLEKWIPFESELSVVVARGLDGQIVAFPPSEIFLTRDGELLVNELAPRPHNSGHYTFDACVTSQFEQQLRAVCGLPLGSNALLTPVVMWNLLGDLWEKGEPDWNVILSEPRAKLHLYGKAEARPGRKMGHVAVLAQVEEALSVIASFQKRLGE